MVMPAAVRRAVPGIQGKRTFSKTIYYKFAYCAYYLKDYANAENLFKGFVEVFPQ